MLARNFGIPRRYCHLVIFGHQTSSNFQGILPKCYFNLNYNFINYIWHIIITFQYLFKGECNTNEHWSVHFHSWNQPLRTKPAQGLEIEWTPFLEGSFFWMIQTSMRTRWQLVCAIIDLLTFCWSEHVWLQHFFGLHCYLEKDKSIWDMQQLDDLTSKLGIIHKFELLFHPPRAKMRPRAIRDRTRWEIAIVCGLVINEWKIKIELAWQFFHLVMRELTMKIALWQLQSIYQIMQNLGQN